MTDTFSFQALSFTSGSSCYCVKHQNILLKVKVLKSKEKQPLVTLMFLSNTMILTPSPKKSIRLKEQLLTKHGKRWLLKYIKMTLTKNSRNEVNHQGKWSYRICQTCVPSWISVQCANWASFKLASSSFLHPHGLCGVLPLQSSAGSPVSVLEHLSNPTSSSCVS